MAEAALETLRRHWKRVRAAETGARDGTDVEGVHDLRVAVRRTRVALRVFRDYLNRGTVRPFRKRLRRTARLLGAARDLEVFEDKARRYLDTLPQDRRTELAPLLTVWRAEHAEARADLLDWLDSHAFARFAADFSDFQEKNESAAGPNGGGPNAARVRDVVPLVLLGGWTSVRAHEQTVGQPNPPLAELHRLRIACKRLRYTFEFFARTLGTPAERLIAELTQVQDHLGNLQDAVVACGILRNFLASGTWSGREAAAEQAATLSAAAPGVAAYLDVRQREIQTLVQTFPEVWAPVRSTEFKKRLLTLIADW